MKATLVFFEIIDLWVKNRIFKTEKGTFAQLQPRVLYYNNNQKIRYITCQKKIVTFFFSYFLKKNVRQKNRINVPVTNVNFAKSEIFFIITCKRKIHILFYTFNNVLLPFFCYYE